MKTSDQGRAFITVLEGERLEPYQDVAGHWTIGVGHLIRDDEQHLMDGITAEESQALLAADLAWAEDAVENAVTVGLCQEEFDALVSWTFNLGAGNLAESTMLRRLNACLRDPVPAEMERWVYAGGKPNAGLVERRMAEGYLFSHRVYDMEPYKKSGVSG